MIERVLFIGSKPLGLAILKEIFSLASHVLQAAITFNDINDGRSALDQFKEFSERTNKTLHVLNKPGDLDSLIDRYKPQLCLVVGWYWILPPATISKVSQGTLGIHASLLPRYRGFSPLVWTLINGEKEGGVSLFYFDEGTDSGDIVSQKKFPIEGNDTIADVLQQAESLSIQMIRENYTLLLNNKAARYKQNQASATYCTRRKPEDGIIDWNLPNHRIYNFIRAQTDPYPGAFTYLGSQKIYLLKSVLSQNQEKAAPGQILQYKNGTVLVACGQGALRIEKFRFQKTMKESFQAGMVLQSAPGSPI